jgi:hypothetical protein
MEDSRSLASIALRVLLRSAACACVAAAVTVAGCTYYQAVPVAPSGPGTFDRSWNAALGAADDLGVSVTSANRVRVEFNVKSPAGDDTDLVNRLSRAYEARMGR